MITVKEKNYFKTLIFVTILLVILFSISMVNAISDIFNGQDINGYIFELIYMAYHYIVLFFAIILEIKAIREGSFILKGLMCQANGKSTNRKGQIISLVLGGLSLLVTIYFSLVYFKVVPFSFSFSKILILLLVNVPFSVFVYALFFFFYPMIVIKK